MLPTQKTLVIQFDTNLFTWSVCDAVPDVYLLEFEPFHATFVEADRIRILIVLLY